jgi:hypothetical protein
METQSPASAAKLEQIGAGIAGMIVGHQHIPVGSHIVCLIDVLDVAIWSDGSADSNQAAKLLCP